MTDQPAPDIQAVVVTVSRVEVNRTGGDVQRGWVTVVREEHSFDLLKVAGIEETLGSAELQAGKYVQTRLHISRVVVTVNGREIEVKVPSDAIRIVGPVPVVTGETTIATLDFDARKSVVFTAGRVQVKPTIKLLVRKGTEPFRPASTLRPPVTIALTPVATPSKPPPGAVPVPGPSAQPRIVFTSGRTDGTDREIHVMNADGSDVKRLTDNFADESSPSLSPDGTKIAFVSHRDNNSDIYVMNADGTNEVRLTTHFELDALPVGRPTAPGSPSDTVPLPGIYG